MYFTSYQDETWRSQLIRVLDALSMDITDVVVFEELYGGLDSNVGSDEYDAGFVAWSTDFVFKGRAAVYNTFNYDVISVVPRNPIAGFEVGGANFTNYATTGMLLTFSDDDLADDSFHGGFDAIFVPEFQIEPPANDIDEFNS